MKAGKLEVAIAGAGYFSQFHYDAWRRMPSVEIIANCDPVLERALEAGREFGVARQYADLATLLDATAPDLVDIVTPPAAQLELVEICAARGCDAIVQKPFGESIAAARKMVRLADAAGIRLIVHENFRFMPWFRRIREIVDVGTLGKILNVEFRLRPGDGQGAEAYLDRQPYFQTMPRFLVHETAIHLVDTFRYLFGEVHAVYAQLRRCNPAIRGEDAATIVFDFDADLQVVFDGNRLLDHIAQDRRTTMGEMTLEGTRGALRLDGDGGLWLREFGDNREFSIEYDWQAQNFGGDCVYRLVEHVVRHYLDGGLLENPAADYLANRVVEEAIYASASKQKKVRLDDFAE